MGWPTFKANGVTISCADCANRESCVQTGWKCDQYAANQEATGFVPSDPKRFEVLKWAVATYGEQLRNIFADLNAHNIDIEELIFTRL